MKKLAIFNSIIKLLVLTLILAMGSDLSSQDIINPFPCFDQDDIPDACLGENYSITFQHSGDASDWSNWSVSYPLGQVDLEFEFLDSDIGTMTGFPITSSFSALGEDTFIVSADFMGSTHSETFFIDINNDASCTDIVASPCMREVAFVLDLSGSMGGASGTPGKTRWERVDDVMTNQIPTMASMAGLDENDRWGIVLFNGNNATLLSDEVFDGTSFPDLSLHIPSGGTPMGGGIQRALMGFFDGLGVNGQGKNRAIILITDGAQNLNPMVEYIPISEQTNIDNDPSSFPTDGILFDDFGLGGFPIDLSSGDFASIKIFAIGIGVSMSSSAEALLTDAFDGLETSPNLAEMDNAFATQIRSFLRDGSPRIVNYIIDDASEGLDYEVNSFTINDQVKSLTFQLLRESGDFSDIDVSVKKDGILIPFEATAINEDMVLVDFNFPYIMETDSLFSSKGEWSFEFLNHDALKYQLTTFVDESQLEFNIDFNGKKKYNVGDLLPVNFKLSHFDTPISGATVKATLLRPGDDLGDLVANQSISPNLIIKSEQQQSLGQSKINNVANERGNWEKLQYVPTSIFLNEESNGTYTGSFTGNEITGNYRVILEIDGTHPESGDFEGWEAKSVFFDFGQSNNITLNEKITFLRTDPDNINIYTITITPINQFNRKIGPAQENRIRMTTKSGSIRNLTDNLDGSYTAELRVPVGTNPDISIYVIDMDNPVSVVPIPPPSNSYWGLSAHGGIASMTSPIDTSGTYWEADISYNFNQNWALGVIGGQYGFDSNFKVSGGSLFGEYTIPGTFITRFAANAGLYKPTNLSTTFGLGGKVSLSYPFGSNFDIGVEGGLLWLPDPDYKIWTAGLGVRYYF